MTALITGERGFLATHIKKLIYNNTISSFCAFTEQDYRNPIAHTDHVLDLIIHTANATKAGDYCLTHKGDQWINHQLIHSNVLNYWFNYHRDAKMVTFGTSCAYDPDVEKTEENYLVGQPDKDLFVYGMTKRMLLIGLQALNDQYGMKYLYFIPSTLYGPGFKDNDSHFIYDLIRKIIIAKKQGTEAVLWGDGYQKRELVYIDDAVSIIANNIHKENEIINISSGIEHSMREYAQIICDIIDYDSSKIIYDETKFTGVKSKVLPNTKNKQHEFVDLKHGIKQTIEYYQNKKPA